MQWKKKSIPVSYGCQSYMLRVSTCEFCSIPLLFVYMRVRMSTNSRSIARVPFDSARRFQTSLLLHKLKGQLCGGITKTKTKKSSRLSR